MSVNNFLKIYKDKKGKYIIKNLDMDTRKGFVVGKADTLEEAIKVANDYQDTYEVEYGLDIRI